MGDAPLVGASGPKALPAPAYEVPPGYTATGKYTPDGRPIFGDGNGGFVASDLNAPVGANKLINVDSKGNTLVGDWTATKKQSAPENALRHANDHGPEFPQYTNAGEYVQAAQGFVQSPPQGTLTKTRPNGDTVFYDPVSDTFAVSNANGTARTMFKPDPAVHGYPTNMDYFNAQ